MNQKVILIVGIVIILFICFSPQGQQFFTNIFKMKEGFSQSEYRHINYEKDDIDYLKKECYDKHCYRPRYDIGNCRRTKDGKLCTYGDKEKDIYRCAEQCPLALMKYDDSYEEKIMVKRDAYEIPYGSSKETIVDVSEPATIVQSCVCVPPTQDNPPGPPQPPYPPVPPFNPYDPRTYPAGVSPDGPDNLPQGCGNSTTGFFTDTGSAHPSPISAEV